MREVTARAPVRIDFGGGWTDVPPYPREEGGCVCCAAIARHTRVRMSRRDEGTAVDAADVDRALPLAALRRAGVSGVSIALHNEFPRGAGLGGSSAAGVAMQAALAAWCGETVDAPTLAERSRAVETEELHVPGGSQDHYAAALGGALDLRFGAAVTARRIPLSATRRAEIERQCVVAYTGESRISGDTITAVVEAYRARDRHVSAALAHMKRLAIEMTRALEHGTMDELAALVREHWTYQRSLHSRISTPGIERVLDAARHAGATGGKALGASGGGCVLLIAPAATVDAVRRAVAAVAEPLSFTLDEEGVRADGR